MNKAIKKVLAFVCACTMMGTLLTGCFGGRAKIDSIWDVIRLALDEAKYTATTDITADIGNGKLSATIEERCDGSATIFSAVVSIGGVNVSLKNMMVITGNELYLNVAGILGGVSSAAKLLNIDVKDYMAETDWVVLKEQGAFDLNLYSDEVINALAILEDTYKEYQTTEDHAFILESEDDETLLKLLNATGAMIAENKEKWSEDGVVAFENQSKVWGSDENGILSQFMDIFVEALIKRGVRIDGYVKNEANKLGESWDQEDFLNAFQSAEESLKNLEDRIQSGELEKLNLRLSAKHDPSLDTYTFMADMNTVLDTEEGKQEVSFSMKRSMLVCEPPKVTIPDETSDLMKYFETSIDKLADQYVSSGRLQELLNTLSQFRGEEGFEWLENIDLSGLNGNRDETPTMKEEQVYVIGKDLPAGRYVLLAKKDVKKKSYTIIKDEKEIDWGSVDVNTFVDVVDGAELGVSGCDVIARADARLDNTGSGIFEVGVDVTAGTYQIKVNKDSETIYYGVYSGIPDTKYFTNHLSGELIKDQVESAKISVTLKNGQFIRLEGCHLE